MGALVGSLLAAYAVARGWQLVCELIRRSVSEQ